MALSVSFFEEMKNVNLLGVSGAPLGVSGAPKGGFCCTFGEKACQEPW